MTWIGSGIGAHSSISMLDCCFMAASQTFPMSALNGTLQWQGACANGYGGSTLWWMPNGDGKVAPGLYVWRFRFWTQTAPGAGGIKFMVSANNVEALTPTKGYNVDDLTAYSAYRESWILPATYGMGEPPGAPTLPYSFSATDATGVLKYDMGVTRIQ